MFLTERVLEYITNQGSTGATAKEVADGIGKKPANIKDHFTKLKKIGEIRGERTREDGRAIRYWRVEDPTQNYLFDEEGDKNEESPNRDSSVENAIDAISSLAAKNEIYRSFIESIAQQAKDILEK